MKFLGLTRGGADGVIAIFEEGSDFKYFEKIAISSMLKTCSAEQAKQFDLAIKAIDNIQSFDEVPEFESGIPQQASLFG